jgi:glycosyltransferase involved in cell wall biosynthesis
LVPAYNEEGAVGNVIAGLRRAMETSGWVFEIIVVDDASRDKTSDEARNAGARVITHPTNSGYGGALRSGIVHAAYDWIATIDADASYPPGELLKLLPHAEKFDMVVGSRQGKNYWGSVFKHPARLIFLALAQFIVGRHIPDVNSGLRLFRKATAMQMLPRLCRGFSFSTTLTLSFLSSHLFVKFQPIDYSLRVGSSKVRYLRDTLRTLQLMMETATYYNPVKASLVLGLFPFGFTAFALALAVVYRSQFWLFAGLMFFCFFLAFVGLGFLMFLVAQTSAAVARENGPPALRGGA